MVESYRDVLERRRCLLGDNTLNEEISTSFYTGSLSETCAQLNTDSCCGRNWRGLSTYLINPDIKTIEDLSNCSNPAHELLCIWIEKCDNEATFASLLKAMIDNESYSSADELLLSLEREQRLLQETHVCNEETLADRSVENVESSTPVSQTETRNTAAITPTKRSKSLVGRVLKWGRKFNRCNSYPPDKTTPKLEIIQPPKKIEDEIFIVSSSTDNKSDVVKNLKSFISKLEPVRNKKWHVESIHDLPAGSVTPTWLQDRVDRAVYVIICCSNIVKEIAAAGQLTEQSEFNLKFTLDLLVTGKIYQDQCLNKGGKFVPILLPGSDLSCVLGILRLFWTFYWPKDLKAIQNYILGTPERQLPEIGPRIPIVPCSLT